jgi:hypothetical protein
VDTQLLGLAKTENIPEAQSNGAIKRESRRWSGAIEGNKADEGDDHKNGNEHGVGQGTSLGSLVSWELEDRFWPAGVSPLVSSYGVCLLNTEYECGRSHRGLSPAVR